MDILQPLIPSKDYKQELERNSLWPKTVWQISQVSYLMRNFVYFVIGQLEDSRELYSLPDLWLYIRLV